MAVLSDMSTFKPSGPDGKHREFTRVPAPRADDAIGSALRNAYARDPELPSDLAVLLVQIDLRTERRG